MIGQSIGGPPGNDGSGPERIAGRLHAGPPVSPSNGYLWPPYKSRGRAKRRIKPAPKRRPKEAVVVHRQLVRVPLHQECEGEVRERAISGLNRPTTPAPLGRCRRFGGSFFFFGGGGGALSRAAMRVHSLSVGRFISEKRPSTGGSFQSRPERPFLGKMADFE